MLGFLLSIDGVSPASVFPPDDEVESPCPAIRVRFDSGSTIDRALVCEGTALARGFFRAHGIEVLRPILVRVYDQPFDPPVPHIGAYSAEERQISLLGYERVRARNGGDTLFGLSMDKALYRSVVVHEVAHAIADQNAEARPMPLVVQEYLAYVAQLSTMAPDLRERILSRYQLAAFLDLDEMSSTYYALDPSGFGIKAFRHFLSREDRGRLLRGLLSGEITPAEPDTE